MKTNSKKEAIKKLDLLFVSLFFFSLVSCSQSKESLLKSVEDSLQKITVRNPKQIEQMSFPYGTLNGKVKYVVEDSYLMNGNSDEKAAIKVPGNCYKYWYNKKGQLTKRQCYFETQVYFEDSFYYKNDLLVKTVFTHFQNNVVDSTIKDYDENKLLRKETYYGKQGVKGKMIFNYDDQGRKVAEYTVNDYSNTINVTNYYYSYLNTPDSIVAYPNTEHIVRTVFKYDQKGRKTEERVISKAHSYVQHYKYDPKTGYAEEHSFGLKKKDVYEYDKHKNWVRLIDLSDGKPLSLRKRVIEYY